MRATSSSSNALALIPAIAVLFLAACGGSGGGAQADSGINGLVTIGPICPVLREGMPCPDEPFAATVLIVDEAGDEVARIDSGANGRFRIELAPGSYTLVPQSPSPGAPPFAQERSVEVRAAAFTQVTIEYDSGIR